jgi:hypothetical protein
MNEYDKGFQAGLIWCARTLRLAARQVEEPRLGQFKTEDSNRTITAISRSGQPRFATSLRAIASEIEQAMGREDAESSTASVVGVHETPVDGGQQERKDREPGKSR